MNKPVTCLLALCLLLSSSCANISSSMGPFLAKNTDSSDEAIALLLEGERQSLPLKVSAEVVPLSTSESKPVPVQVEPRFDLQVDEAQAAEFFRSLVLETAYNMVVHPDVKGTVSLALNDVTIFDVMQVMRDVYSYDFVLRGNVFQVYPDVLRTEIYHVNYLNVSRSGRSETQVSAGKVGDSEDSGNNRNSNGYNDYDNDQNNQGSSQVVGTIVNTSAEANLWQELTITLENMVAADEGSSVMVTPQVGLVVVKAKPQTLHAVEDFLGLVDSALSRQVVLEAKIIEVTLKEGFQAGIDWHSFGDASGGTFDPTTVILPDGSTATTAGSEHSVAGEFLSGANEIFNPMGTAFSLSTAFGDFDATIDLLQTQGSVQVLSSPRIATVNNQKAVIKVGSDEFFVTDISTNTITAGSAINTSDSPELTPFFSGIALDVTPQISAANEVILHVHPTVSDVTEQRKIIGGQLVPLAASTIRESDSIVKARSGQIIVIGGLMQNSSRDVNAGVPWLSRIPVMGNLFKQKNQNSVKSELIILLKPMVIENGSTKQMLGESADRASALRQQIQRRG